jgi:hypothetical protein
MARGVVFEAATAVGNQPLRPDAPPDALRPDDMLDIVVGLDRQINALTALRTRALDLARRESDAAAVTNAGAPTFGSSMLRQRAFRAEVAAALRVSERSAENLIGNAQALVEGLPTTLAELDSGRISYRHAVALVDETAGLDDESRAALETAVLPRAAETTAAKLRSAARTARERLRPESIERRQATARERRGVSVIDGRDGMATLLAELPSAHAHAVLNRLTAAATALRLPDDTRAVDQRRADILISVLLADGAAEPFGVIPDQDDSDNFVKWFRGVRAEVMVSVPVLSLLGRSNEPATLDGVVPIDAQTARILAGGAKTFTRILTHPETGATLSVGRKRYTVPKDLRRYVQIRDVVCRFPGCFRPAAHCDIDHTLDWQFAGTTDHANLACLCRGHHTLKGETDWTVEQASDGSGVLRWTSPTGRDYVTQPATHIA